MSTADGAREVRGEPAPPCWVKNGELDTEKLKQVVSGQVKKLSASRSLGVRREGVDAFLSLVKRVWTLETHVARDSADLIANELR